SFAYVLLAFAFGRSTMGKLRMRSGPYPQQQRPLTDRPRFLWRALSTLLPLFLTSILLPVIAFASSPDPTWIGGIYDGADGDDIVMLVYEIVATEPGVQSSILRLPCQAQGLLDGIVNRLESAPFISGSRAPPAAWSTASDRLFTFLPTDRSPPSGAHGPFS